MAYASNSTRKLALEVIPKPSGDEWIDVVLLKYRERPRFRPSFEDIYRIVDAIARCEDQKYPPPCQGRWQFAAFLQDCFVAANFPDLARKWKIPIRDGDRIVTTNGARTAERPFGDIVHDADPLTVEENNALDAEILRREQQPLLPGMTPLRTYLNVKVTE